MSDGAAVYLVEDIISAEDIRRNQRVTITKNGSGYIVSYDFLGTGKHYEKWFDDLVGAQGRFFLFCFDFVNQAFTDEQRLCWVDGNDQ